MEEIRCRTTDSTILKLDDPSDIKYGVWISFMEIYNEQLHDLLDLTAIGKGKKRNILKLGDDRDKNPYVKGLELCVISGLIYKELCVSGWCVSLSWCNAISITAIPQTHANSPNLYTLFKLSISLWFCW